MTTALRTILLATDGSPSASVAGDVAGSIARQSGAQLQLMHTWQLSQADLGMGMASDNWQYMVDSYEHLAKDVVDAEAARLEQAGVQVAGRQLAQGRPATEINVLAEELKADLVVMGSRGLGPIRRLVLGSVTDEVVHHATRPVLVIRGDAGQWPPQQIIVGDDGSPTAEAAAQLAAALGSYTHAGLTMLRVYPELPIHFQMSDPMITKTPPINPQTERQSARELDARIGQAEGELTRQAEGLAATLGIRPAVRVLVGNPAEELLAQAELGSEPTLLVVGSRGLGLVQRWRLGSVSTTVLHAATGPVLVVPAAQ